jgi:allophanate hydrolase subunit 2
MKVLVVHPGLQDTIQDLGRTAFWSYGVPEGGAADRASLVLANRLVGNQDEAAGLEFTLRGPVLTFPEGGFVAFTGALFEIKRSAGSFARNTTIRLAPGETLEIGKAILGCRGYLALSGGIEVKAVLDSRSTFLPAGFGGMRGRALCQGDELLFASDGHVF